ncbi:hypothetical protein N0B16_07990 [Chryseobacterium sp. GMJ5]|uniref:Lipoprotein n=1 Tax=Chryseobacterium gilvum TaxID=2976534 RepID=A0ABT2VWV0_9FLAO|nr:hypothetical protein [Chryseobacterium gilvum]MCU7614376.1 hypothetical protein [Chryseobacterium gilvum]
MKKYILILLALSGIISCSSINKRNNNWKQDFKDRTLYKCLIAGYNDKNITKGIFKIDKSLYNPIATTIFDEKIDSILLPINQKMRNDSLNSLNKISEAKAGKQVFNTCLKLYKSSALDREVEIESNKWKKIKNIDSLLEAKNPAF